MFYSQRETDQKNVEDILFDMFKNESTDTLHMGRFLAALRTTGKFILFFLLSHFSH